LPGGHLLVEQFKPQHCARQTPDQQPLRDRRMAADGGNKLALNLA
jgi:hypothetical protein